MKKIKEAALFIALAVGMWVGMAAGVALVIALFALGAVAILYPLSFIMSQQMVALAIFGLLALATGSLLTRRN